MGGGQGWRVGGEDEIVGFRWFSQDQLFLGPDLYLPIPIPGPYESLFPSLGLRDLTELKAEHARL